MRVCEWDLRCFTDEHVYEGCHVWSIVITTSEEENLHRIWWVDLSLPRVLLWEVMIDYEGFISRAHSQSFGCKWSSSLRYTIYYMILSKLRSHSGQPLMICGSWRIFLNDSLPPPPDNLFHINSFPWEGSQFFFLESVSQFFSISS